MAHFASPILFSKQFGIDPKELDGAGLIDPFLNVDKQQLLIDPVLLPKSSNKVIAKDGVAAFRKSSFTDSVRIAYGSLRERRILSIE